MIGSAVFKMSQFACLYIREEKNTGLFGNFYKRGKVISGPFYIILYSPNLGTQPKILTTTSCFFGTDKEKQSTLVGVCVVWC